jgi:hypothetical protein
MGRNRRFTRLATAQILPPKRLTGKPNIFTAKFVRFLCLPPVDMGQRRAAPLSNARWQFISNPNLTVKGAVFHKPFGSRFGVSFLTTPSDDHRLSRVAVLKLDQNFIIDFRSRDIRLIGCVIGTPGAAFGSIALRTVFRTSPDLTIAGPASLAGLRSTTER